MYNYVSMAYDILIKSGLVIDGTGKAPVLADVGIKGEEISAVGDLGNSPAKVIIDAYNKYVTPGFIDITNHSDTHLTFFKYPLQSSLLTQGVTTIIGGNCGASLAPLGRADAISVLRKWADLGDLNINWTSLEEYLAVVGKLKLGVNYGTLTGFGTLRRGVIGNKSRPLDFEEKEKSRLLLYQSLEEGSFGLSLGLSYGHEKISSAEEIIDIASVLSGTRRVLKFHLRSEGKQLLASVNEVVRIGREVGAPVHISHLKAIGKQAWPDLPRVLELINQARSSGIDISFDVSPYKTTGSLLYLLVPAWARQGGFNELFKRINDPVERRKIIDALKSSTLHYESFLIISAKTKNIVGKTLKNVALLFNLSPEETLLSILKANEGRVVIVGKTLSAENLDLAIRDVHSLIASDGEGYEQAVMSEGNLLHPRCFGAFPHFWHKFAAERKYLSPEEAIRKISTGPAVRMGIKGRGLLCKGYFADVVIFDPKLFKNRATYRNPFSYAAGMSWVLINGLVAVENGRVSGVRAGKILKRYD